LTSQLLAELRGQAKGATRPGCDSSQIRLLGQSASNRVGGTRRALAEGHIICAGSWAIAEGGRIPFRRIKNPRRRGRHPWLPFSLVGARPWSDTGFFASSVPARCGGIPRRGLPDAADIGRISPWPWGEVALASQPFRSPEAAASLWRRVRPHEPRAICGGARSIGGTASLPARCTESVGWGAPACLTASIGARARSGGLIMIDSARCRDRPTWRTLHLREPGEQLR